MAFVKFNGVAYNGGYENGSKPQEAKSGAPPAENHPKPPSQTRLRAGR